MNKFIEITDKEELQKLNGGSLSGGLALAWGITKAVGIVGGSATVVYVAGKAVKKAGDWIISRF